MCTREIPHCIISQGVSTENVSIKVRQGALDEMGRVIKPCPFHYVLADFKKYFNKRSNHSNEKIMHK